MQGWSNKFKFYSSSDCSGEALDTTGASYFGSEGDYKTKDKGHAFDTNDETFWQSLNYYSVDLGIEFPEAVEVQCIEYLRATNTGARETSFYDVVVKYMPEDRSNWATMDVTLIALEN